MLLCRENVSFILKLNDNNPINFIFSFIEDMEELTENEDLQILKQEISALCIHPMKEEIMVAAGDLKGNVGIWLKVSLLIKLVEEICCPLPGVDHILGLAYIFKLI